MTSYRVNTPELNYIFGDEEEEDKKQEDYSVTPEEINLIQEEAQDEDPLQKQDPSRWRSLLDVIPRAFLQTAGGAFGAGLHDTQDQQFDATIDELLPIQKDRDIEGAIDAVTRLALQSTIGGPIAAGKGALAGALGYLSKYIPFVPEGAKGAVRTGVELATFAKPKLGSKIIPKNAEQTKLIESARKLGMTEKEIAPLIQSEKKVSSLSKVAGKRFRTQKALKRSGSAVDKLIGGVETHPDTAIVMAPPQARTVISNIEAKMASKLNSYERSLIQDDFNILKNSKKSGSDFIKFFRDLNKQISTNPKSRKALNLLKGDITGAVETISPELGEVFNTSNKLYSNYSKIAAALTPSWNETIAKTAIKATGHVVVSTLFGNKFAMAKILGESGAKNLSREMLINPRFQNLSRQIVQSLKSGKIGIVSSLWNKLRDLVDKTSPKMAEQMNEVDWKDLAKEEKSIENE